MISLEHTRVLVTGGAGFIGSHLVEQLVKLKAQVTVLDNLSTGSLANLEAVKDSITFIHGDITDAELCLTVTKQQAVIFHLAAFISVPDSLRQPDACHNINVNGTLILLEACRKNSVHRFIFASSAAVYGNYEGICFEDLTCIPTSPYGLSKLISEHYCRLYSHCFGIKTVCLRFFNVFGSRQNALLPCAGLGARIRHSMAHNAPITIYGDGSQTRDFIPVDTVAHAMAQAAFLADHLSDGRAINIGSGTSISLLEFAQHIKATEFPEYALPFQFAPARAGDVQHSQADCNRLKSLLNPIKSAIL